MFPKYYFPLKTTVRCFLLPSEQPGSLLEAIWCLLEILNTELLLPLFARWHAAKLKTGSTGSCDQLARVPLVRQFSSEFEIELVSEILSSQFSCVTLFPRFFPLSYAGLRFTPLCRPLTTDWTRKSHFFRPVWPSFSPRLSPTRTCNGGKWNVSLGELIYCPFSLHF